MVMNHAIETRIFTAATTNTDDSSDDVVDDENSCTSGHDTAKCRLHEDSSANAPSRPRKVRTHTRTATIVHST